ncbi:MAG: hypothetical protein ACWA5A_07140 [Marinibacterium sp.]
MVLPAVFNINSLDGQNGFVVEGINPFFGNAVSSGGAVSPAGDINGDGIDDFVIGAERAVSLDPVTNQQRFTAGEVYVIFGTLAGLPASVDPASLDGTNGFRLLGGREAQGLGFAVSSAGDINGDGIDDLLIGTRATTLGQTAEPGEAFVVFGKTTPFAPVLDIYALPAGEGTRAVDTQPSVPGQFGRSVTNIGDFDGDGFDDFAVGEAKNGNPGGFPGPAPLNESGAVHIVFGGSDPFPPIASGANDFDRTLSYFGPLEDAGFGTKVSGIGDFNGDGLDDFIALAPGAPFRTPSELFAMVIFGTDQLPAQGSVTRDLRFLPQDASEGFILRNLGDPAGDVANAGDVNGDGFDDFIVGGPNALGGRGVAYVVYGTDNPDFNLLPSALDGTNGFTIRGESAGDFLGSSVHAAGDVNNDGFDDVIIGALGANRSSGGGVIASFLGGAAYVVYGGPGGGRSTVDVAALDGNTGFKVEGISPFSVNPDDALGTAVSGGMDVNGDGIDDILIGAPNATSAPGDVQNVAAGRTYVIYGQQAPLSLTGTNGDDTLVGKTANDQINGRGGDDILRGGAGDDVLTGGAGKDDLDGGAGDDVLNGGKGVDTAIFKGNVDTTVSLGTGTVQDTGHGKDQLTRIENATTGNGNDRLTGSNADNVLTSGGGNDTLKGGKGDDTLKAGKGNDSARGGAGSDSLIGGGGKDTLSGGKGNDDLDGGKGRDMLDGGKGKDRLEGGAGNDALSGGGGDDTFVFAGRFGADAITDFDALRNGEKIDLSGVAAIKSWKDLSRNHLSDAGADVIIDDLNGNTITLENMSLADLNAGDFLF